MESNKKENNNLNADDQQTKEKADKNKERIRQVIRVLVALPGAGLGSMLVLSFSSISKLMEWNIEITPWYYIFGALLFGILFYFLAPKIVKFFANLIRSIEQLLNSIPMIEIFFGSAGLVVGLIIAFLLSNLVAQFPLPAALSAIISTTLYIVFGILGWSIARKRRGELRFGGNAEGRAKDSKGKKGKGDSEPDRARPKILDTSVIIDGRIFDICKTGIMEGRIIIPNFVLQELRHVSDSSDSLKRTRGRRGLDILNKIQKELELSVEVTNIDYEDISEVDAKLLRLALDIDGTVITNDYNLNKVAAVQSVPVLNINELANAVKPVVLPGEEMTVTIIKDGKEPNQGVGYLDDGTMIVVEGGRNMAGQTKDLIVTSVLQTSAGRMIFAKVK